MPCPKSPTETPAPITPTSGRVIPNFLVVGSAKCGTCSLADYLGEHPDVYMARREVYFFSRDRNWRAGLDWYSRAFGGWDGETAIGERTTAYSYRPAASPPVPFRIARTLGSPRLIWSLRNPVERAYSHYLHAVRRGREGLSFEQALEVRNRPDDRAYLDRGVYVDQIRLYLQHFTPEQILFVRFEDLVERPAEVAARMFRFVGVDPSFRGQRPGARRNAGWVPWSPVLQTGIRRVFVRRDSGQLGRVADTLMRLNRSRGDAYPPMKGETRAFLSSFYQGHNAELAELIGIDVSGWS